MAVPRAWHRYAERTGSPRSLAQCVFGRSAWRGMNSVRATSSLGLGAVHLADCQFGRRVRFARNLCVHLRHIILDGLIVCLDHPLPPNRYCDAATSAGSPEHVKKQGGTNQRRGRVCSSRILPRGSYLIRTWCDGWTIFAVCRRSSKFATQLCPDLCQIID